MKYLRNINPFEAISMTDMISHSGKSIAMEANIDYGIEALTDVKLFNILVKVD